MANHPSFNQPPALSLVLIWVLFGTVSIQGQSFVYGSREYLKAGRSYRQIHMMDIETGKSIQLSKSARDHEIPWCTSDGSVYFTIPSEKAIYRLDRMSGQESKVMPMPQDLRAFIGEMDDQHIAVQKQIGDHFEIEILDLKARRSIRKFPGMSAAISPDYKSIAYASPPSTPDAVSHVYVAGIRGGNILDLGEGATPAFFPTGEKIAYTLPQESKNASQISTIIYDLKTGSRDSRIFSAVDEVFAFACLTIAPDGLTMVLATQGGAHGSYIYYLLRSGLATVFDKNLPGWAGWSSDGLLLYPGEQDVRALDRSRKVWVNDIRDFDSRTGRVRTLIKGISTNIDPAWCVPHGH